MTGGRAKLIYRAERHPRFDQAGFIQRWRAHAKLGMSQKRWINVWRYVHADPVVPAAAARDCAGIALLWYKSETARLAHVSDDAARSIMRPDEIDTFARPVKDCAALLDEAEIVPARDSGAVCFTILRGDVGASGWIERRLATLRPIPGFCGYTLNRPRADSVALGFGLVCDAIEEIACDAPVDLPPPPAATVLEAIWTRPIVLYRAA